jgi:ATP phosphoribosyltransferase
MPLKLALPKGRLLPSTNLILQKAGLDISDYNENSRSYRPQCSNMPNLKLKIFHEKDVPIQVSVGNYDLGICGLDWIEELLAKYPSSSLIKVLDLNYGHRNIYAAASSLSGLSSIEELRSTAEIVRIASEYPNLAEFFAMNLRLRRFKIFSLWGAAEVYPPENAEIVLISDFNASDNELVFLSPILHSNAFLIANKNSWESKDLRPLLQLLYTVSSPHVKQAEHNTETSASSGKPSGLKEASTSTLRLALPDGHQQEPIMELLKKCGIEVWGYSSGNRRPEIAIEDTSVKTIRPQDMPIQVANGYFDLAVSGQDWLRDHLYQFPSSPVTEILGLGYGKVRIVAVVSNDLSANNLEDLREMLRSGKLKTLRIASEYVNIADRYAQTNRLSPYRIIPTWGATEAFLPEDADLLIENTQTGRTIAEHNLKIIDTLFESTACVIGNTQKPSNGTRLSMIEAFVNKLRCALPNTA